MLKKTGLIIQTAFFKPILRIIMQRINLNIENNMLNMVYLLKKLRFVGGLKTPYKGVLNLYQTA
jgi:hypothetical protein